jgi:predicted DNA-binding protein (UPF0251 family)
MARPISERRISAGLRECIFRPVGVRAKNLSQVVLGFDELEAIRLADLLGMYQQEAARKMGVSRQTFGRIVESARRKVSQAIIERKCLRIECGRAVKVRQSRGKEPSISAVGNIQEERNGIIE